MTYHKNINNSRPGKTTKVESQQVLDVIPYDGLISRQQIVAKLKNMSRLSKNQIYKQIGNFARDGKIKKVHVFADRRTREYHRVGVMG